MQPFYSVLYNPTQCGGNMNNDSFIVNIYSCKYLNIGHNVELSCVVNSWIAIVLRYFSITLSIFLKVSNYWLLSMSKQNIEWLKSSQIDLSWIMRLFELSLHEIEVAIWANGLMLFLIVIKVPIVVSRHNHFFLFSTTTCHHTNLSF